MTWSQFLRIGLVFTSACACAAGLIIASQHYLSGSRSPYLVAATASMVAAMAPFASEDDIAPSWLSVLLALFWSAWSIRFAFLGAK